MRNKYRRFWADRSGNVGIMSALFLTLVFGMTAFGVDVGSVYANRRKAQGITDIAAIVAASNISNAAAGVAATIAQNNYNASAPAVIQTGVYVANSTLPPAQRFAASASPSANAVQVTLQTSTPLFFGRLLAGQNSFNIQTTATATTTAFASFAIGSTLASVNNGLLNQILGQLLGTSLSLSVMDYQALASANLDLFSFMNSLASRLNVTGVTYNTLLSGNARIGTVVNAMLDSERATSGSSATISALSQIASALNGTTANMPLSSLLNPGPYGTMTIGQTPPNKVSASLLNMLAAAASLANGNNQVAASLNAGLPGIASVSMLLAIGQPPVGTSWVTVGPVGASVYTTQTRLLLTVQLLGNGTIASLNVPIYVAVAYGTATLNAVSCGYPNIANSTVTLGVTPGIVNAWIGNVTPAAFYNMSQPPQPGPATLANVLGVTLNGFAHVTIGNTTPTPVTFTYAQIQAQTGQTVNTTQFTSSLTSQLLQSLQLTASLGVIQIAVPPLLSQAVTNIITPETASLDQLLASILATVGVSVGQATVWVTGIRCDGAVLVN
jgi:uncharacterized membrane protein